MPVLEKLEIQVLRFLLLPDYYTVVGHYTVTSSCAGVYVGPTPKKEPVSTTQIQRSPRGGSRREEGLLSHVPPPFLSGKEGLDCFPQLA